MQIWGITGLMGSGKTTATQYLSSLGYPTIDADQVGRIVVDRNTEVGREGFSAIYKMFGETVLDRQGNLDRSALRKRIMLNPSDKDRLQSVIDPLTFKHIEKVTRDWGSTGAEFGFVEGSRLAEAGFHNVLKGMVQIVTSIEKRINRVSKRDTMGKQEVEMMFRLQDREELMRRVCKGQWKNDGTQKALQAEIDKFLAERSGK